MDGKEYNLRRLSLDDIEMMADIIGDIITGASIRGTTFKADESGGSIADFMMFVLLGLPFAAQKVNAWIKSIIEDFPEDGTIYMPDTVRLVKGLIDHPDVLSFLELAKEMFGSLSKAVATDESPSQ